MCDADHGHVMTHTHSQTDTQTHTQTDTHKTQTDTDTDAHTHRHTQTDTHTRHTRHTHKTHTHTDTTRHDTTRHDTTRRRQESHSSSSSSASPSSPTVGEIPVREREDAPNSDISPVPVSELVDDRSGKPEEIQANEIPKTNKKETTIERGNPLLIKPIKLRRPKEPQTERRDPCDSEIPEWLQEFRENLVDDENPLQGGSHACSSHEVSSEPTFKRRQDFGKHIVHTHFPQDRNCEICKRTSRTSSRKFW